MTSTKQQVGRLAMRVEGRWWCAYYAQPDTMAKAVRLGKVHMSVVQDEGRKQAFMRIFRSFVADLLEQQTGHKPSFAIEDAPEHERGKGKWGKG